ncbi:hypothetical protein CL621_00950 [archaeon]|nr:hypothetical protein [archaeon]|tara:strand:- start:487 stop:891 length:405 start_codon:yes stop_codon:yes gene_type:complete
MNSSLTNRPNGLHNLLDGLSGFTSEIEWPFSRPSSSVSYSNFTDKNGDQVVEMAVPGYAKKDINIDIIHDILTISSKNDITNDSSLVLRNFRRSFRLSENCDIDSITAIAKDGLLRITIPASNKTTISKQIKVN